MPGAARMYPETDLPLLKISKQKKSIKMGKLGRPKKILDYYGQIDIFDIYDVLPKIILQLLPKKGAPKKR